MHGIYYSAGKPLRIKLAQRLSLGVLDDSVPAAKRHFEADVPPQTAALSDPISCRGVRIDLNAIELSIHKAYGVHDVALRHRSDGSAEAFVSAAPGRELSAASIREFLASFLPGYALPEPLHVLSGPLSKRQDGSWDFEFMEQEIVRENANKMSSVSILVRDVVAELLNIDAGMITNESDFFLLGGNSLLLGKLSYLIRKKTGQTVPIAAIFVNSTIKGIAGLLDEPSTPGSESVMEEKIFSAATSVTMFNESGTDSGFHDIPAEKGKGGRSQNHILCLIAQAIPFVFFYPLKAAITCEYRVQQRLRLID
jgi:acyl carrier protein